MPRHFLIMGPPQAGKGTQAQLLAERFSLLHLATGNLLREISQEHSERGRKVSDFLARGEYVPDDLVTNLVIERMNAHDVLLDGYPRTVAQAETLEDLGIRVDRVLVLNVPEADLLQRAAERLTCPQCGAIFSLTIDPPKVPWICDVCGNGLAQRLDDAPATVQHRLKVYVKRSEPVVQWYLSRGLVEFVDGRGSIADVQSQLVAAVAVFYVAARPQESPDSVALGVGKDRGN
ncbi:MAG: nucleoside monophosphate kinase [Chloroflexi bacterium]|nr:nucleoside monophosphate kinase [Chloroflexota bacterium]